MKMDLRRWAARAALATAPLAASLAPTAGAQEITLEEIARLRTAGGAIEALDGADQAGVLAALRSAQAASLDSLAREAERSREIPALIPDPEPPTPPAEAGAPSPGLPAFGYDIFQRTDGLVSTEPGPVGPEYLVGPGDELVLTVWGDVELVQTATVDREGRVFFRDVGLQSVGGIRLGQVKRELGLRLEQMYSGLGGEAPSTFFDLTLARLRTVNVFVFGEVGRPGAYRVPSNGTVLDALYRAGGATRRGSLRDVRVMRGSEQVGTFDLYRALVDGDLSSDVRLESGHVVLVPPVGPRVELHGEVLRPAIYELRDGETLSDLIRIAGGLLPTAYRHRASVERVQPIGPVVNGREYDWVVLTVGAGQIDGTTPFPLENGDRVQVLRLSEERGGFVQLTGSGFWKDGRLAWEEGMTLARAIELGGGLRQEASLEEVHVVRKSGAHRETPREMVFSLSLEPGADDASFVLEERDVILVRSVYDFTDPDSVLIDGEVREPGAFPLQTGLTLQDLIFLAGGLKNQAFGLTAEVARVDPALAEADVRAIVRHVSLAGWEEGTGEAARFELSPYDQVHVRRQPGWELQRNVRITGEIRFPGTYALERDDERISGLIERAGGLTSRAFPPAAVFVRRRGDAGRIAVDITRAIEKPGRREDLVVEPGDEIHIPEEPRTVKVVGEVGFPSSVLFRPGRRVDYYIDQAGGFTKDAAKDEVLVKLAGGGVLRGKGGFMKRAPRVDAGSIVLVPKEPEEASGNTLRDVANIVSILAGAATTAYLIGQATN